MRFLIAAGLALVATPGMSQQVLDNSDENFSWSVKKLVLESLIQTVPDPYSAQIIKLHKAKDRPGVACGLINLKNDTGGYVGFKPFYFDSDHGRLALQDIVDCQGGQDGGG